jgi:uncharacterized glyoxalase superfamily protein PhnB
MLRYEDARGAITFLCEVFGFVELFSVPPKGAVVRHAQLKLGTNVIMLGSVRAGERILSPQTLGAATQAIYVYVEKIDAHCNRARAAGARIVSEPADSDFGTRGYSAQDSEGHLWNFGTYHPDQLAQK